MNWETYTTLTEPQKEEYNFKYKDNPLFFDGARLINSTTMFLFVVTQFIMTTYLAMTDEAFAGLRDQVTVLMETAMRIISAVTIFIIIFLLVSVIHISYRIYDERRWMKKNNIKKIKGTPFWRK